MTSSNLKNDTTHIEIVELHPQELQLLKSIRNNWRFGEVVILTRDGLPFRLKRVTEFIDLDKTS
jgi:hypothetical protein